MLVPSSRLSRTKHFSRVFLCISESKAEFESCQFIGQSLSRPSFLPSRPFLCGSPILPSRAQRSLAEPEWPLDLSLLSVIHLKSLVRTKLYNSVLKGRPCSREVTGMTDPGAGSSLRCHGQGSSEDFAGRGQWTVSLGTSFQALSVRGRNEQCTAAPARAHS